MKRFSSGFIAGMLFMLLGLVGIHYFKDKATPLADVTVTQVSGEKITHDGFNYTSDRITFSTHAEGSGEIITEIPKTNIPEARYWMENTNGVMLELLFTEEDRIYGASYMRRWGNFSAGGGVLFSEKKFEGVKIQGMYWFEI